MLAFGVVELQRAGDGVEDLGGGAVDGAAFELGVVLDAEPGERGDLAASQPGHPPVAAGGQADLVRGDLGPSGHEEVAYFLVVVHDVRVRAARRRVGCPVGTPLDVASHNS